jgi:hypothetical protein
VRVALALALALVVAAPANAVKRRAFVTSVTGTGNLHSWADSGGLSGVAAGDNICRVRAAAGGLPNPTAYRAWLSTAATDAYCHVQGQTGKKDPGCVGTPEPAGPWYRYDGVGRFTGTLDELTGPERRIYQPIRYDELGNDATTLERSYWTGTDSTGEVAADICGSWVVASSGASGKGGAAEESAGGWTSSTIGSCAGTSRLLCLEAGASEVTPVPWIPAALVFATSTQGHGDLSAWPGANGEDGLAAGDAICRSRASAAHLPSPASFFAWLSTDSIGAGTRMTLAGTPYRRVDGFRIASSAADLLANGADNTLHVDEFGQYASPYRLAFTGTLPDGTPGLANCAGWTSVSAFDEATYGLLYRAYDGTWTDRDEGTCSGTEKRLICFSNREVLFWDGFDLSENTERWSAVVP